MEIEVKVDNAYEKTKIVIFTAEINDEVNDLIKKLTKEDASMLAGFQGEVATILEPSLIIRIYTESKKVYAVTKEGVYEIRLRLYELESLLDKRNFVRISNSEMINLQKVDKMDLSFTGTIHIKLENGQVSYASRRYVARIKKILGL